VVLFLWTFKFIYNILFLKGAKSMFVPKLITCLKDYSKEQFMKDFIAGLIVAIIAFPLSIALAIASGVSPEKGLYTAVIGGFIVSLLGGSRVQIGGPTGAFIVIVYGIIEKYGFDGLIVASIIAGVFLILMGLLKFGSVIKYIPYPIVTGFTSGIAITIFSTQIKDFLGLTMDKVPSEFIPKWIEYFRSMPSLNIKSLFIGILSLVIILIWPKLTKKIPGTLAAIFVATIINLIFGLQVETIGSRFGSISAAFPRFSLPNINLALVSNLLLPGITIAVLAGVESLLSAVVADGMTGGKHRSNMELIAQGTANIVSVLFGGIPVTGAIARTAANVRNGGRTPVAGIVHSVMLFFIMIVFLPYMKLVPMSTLAAILIVVSYNMGEWEVFKRLSKAPKSDAVVFLVTFSLTILIDLVAAIGVGMVLASLLFMKRMADVTDIKYIVDSNEEDGATDLLSEAKIPENVSFYEINGPLFFGAADKFVNVIKEINYSSKVLILKMTNVQAMDATVYHSLEDLFDTCKHSKTELVLIGLQSQPLKMLNKYGFTKLIHEENICINMEQAISRASEIIEGAEYLEDEKLA
jgi:sulfate permease, SulP family